MPELPEVEIAARNLRAWTRGRRLVRLEADPKARYVFRPSTPRALARALGGARFGEIRRIGKQLLVAMDRDSGPVGGLGRGRGGHRPRVYQPAWAGARSRPRVRTHSRNAKAHPAAVSLAITASRPRVLSHRTSAKTAPSALDATKKSIIGR